MQHPARSSHSSAEEDERLDLAGIRVLVVDDDGDARELLHCMLSDAGATVACADSVRQAFELLVSARPEVIISDIEMPDENGYSFIRNLRSVLDEDGGKTPAIALTGRGLPEDKQRSLSSGFNLHLTKPIALEDLLKAVRTVIASR
jgi:CheY-like chemotaxis protein